MFVITIVGIAVFIGIAWLCSIDRRHVRWRSVLIVLAIQLILGWFFTSFSVGRDIVSGAANGFNWLVNVSYKGIAFALPDWVSKSLGVGGSNPGAMNFVTSALLPILMIVPLFDILTYIGFLPWVIKWIGRALSFVTGQPKYEAFFSVEMMFLGNTEVLAVSKTQLQKMDKRRNLTLALMSMSCVTASILGAYTTMMPGQYVLTAVPLNILGAIIIASILNPVKVPKEEDVIYGVGGVESGEEAPQQPVADKDSKADTAEAGTTADATVLADTAAATVTATAEPVAEPEGSVDKRNSKQTKEAIRIKVLTKSSKGNKGNKPKKAPFFSFLGDSILGAGKLVLIILATVIAFVALAALIDAIFSLTGFKWLSLENIVGCIMFPFAWLLGFDPSQAFELARLMGTKLVTNEFVAMGAASKDALAGLGFFASRHFTAATTVFLTSFANFGTMGMILGAFKGLVDKEKVDHISKQVPRMFLSGILVSLLSAAAACLFVW